MKPGEFSSPVGLSCSAAGHCSLQIQLEVTGENSRGMAHGVAAPATSC